MIDHVDLEERGRELVARMGGPDAQTLAHLLACGVCRGQALERMGQPSAVRLETARGGPGPRPGATVESSLRQAEARVFVGESRLLRAAVTAPGEARALDWLEGKFALHAGELDWAEAKLDSVRKAFLGDKWQREAALCSAELACVFARKGERERIGTLIDDLHKGFAISPSGMRVLFATQEVTENMNEKGGKTKIRRPSPREFEKLKAERVQLVAEKLKIMPRWELINDGTALRRVHEFSDARVALAYASYVAELSTAENVPASVLITGARAVVNVRGVRQGGFRNLTDKILDFADELG